MNKGLTNSEIRRALDAFAGTDSDDDIATFLPHTDNIDSNEEENIAVDDASESEEEVIENDTDEEDEQVGSDSQDYSDLESENVDEIGVYISKDGTQWNSSAFPNNRTRSILRTPSDKVMLPPGKIVNQPVDCFNLYLDNAILNTIVCCTNFEARRSIGTEWKNIDLDEIKAFLGLLLTAGTNKQSKVDISEFWHPIFGNPIFQATKGKNRFKIILKFLRFDNKETRSERRVKDKLAPIRDVWETINKNLKKYYMPGANLTVDEQLIPFRGRVGFKQYIPSKPDKYGMKMWWICDNATSYPLQGIPYLGKEGSARAQNLAQNIVEQLCEPYFASYRNVTFDNFFTSIQLAQSLLSNGLTIVGTLRKNKKCIPKEFLPNNIRLPESNCFGFRKNITMVSYVPKKNRAVILLSTKHYNNTIEPNKKNKSEINLFYNKTKGGVDTLDQMAHNYAVRKRTNRWPIAFFHNLIDIAGIAAFVIWKKLQPTCKLSRKQFLRSIAQQLVTPYIRKRSHKGLSTQKRHITELFPEQNEGKPNTTSEPEHDRKKRRCHICPFKISRTSKQVCEYCGSPMCMEHSKKIILCKKCIGN